MRIPPLILVAVFCATPGHAVCQVEAAASETGKNIQLRIQLTDSTILMGRLLAWQSRSFLLLEFVRSSLDRLRAVRREVPLDSVSLAWVRAGSHWKRGAAAGAVVGTVVMLAAGLVVLEEQDGSSCSAWCWTSALTAGAAAGAALGALVGHQFVIWRPLRF